MEMEIFQNFSLFSVISLVSAFIFTCLVIYLNYNEKALKRKRFASLLPGPKPLFYFGNALGFIQHPEDIAAMILFYSKKYSSSYRLWIGNKLTVVISDANDAEDALKGNKFLNKGDDFHNLFGRAFGNSTFSGNGSKWKNSRKILQHPLKTNVLENYVDIMNCEVNKMLRELEPKAKDNQSFDVLDYIGPVTFGILCKTLYDLKDEVPKDEYHIFRQKAAEFLDDSFCLMFFPKLIRRIKQLISRSSVNKMVRKMALNYYRVSSEGNLSKKGKEEGNEAGMKNFIDYLLDPTFSDEDKKSEIVTYSVGGTETVSITTSFTMLMLGIHKWIQDKVFDELEDIFGDSDRDATCEDIKKMFYLEQVLKEVMRLFPVVPFLFRFTHEDTTFGECNIPAGTEVIFNVIELHNNSRYFPDPESFDPERFSMERSPDIPKGGYLPFAIGPRNCIGKAFAMYELKIVCSAILRKYCIHTSMKKEDIKLKYSFVLSSASGYNISVSRRNKA